MSSEDFAVLLQVHLILIRVEIQVQTHWNTHISSLIQFTLSSLGVFFSLHEGGGLALLWPCSCILGFLTSSQGANKTLLYLWGRAAFRLSCRRLDETQHSHTVTGCYSMNEQRRLEIPPYRPGGSQRFLQAAESTNLQTNRMKPDMWNK